MVRFGTALFQFIEPGDTIEGTWKGVEEGVDFDFGVIQTEEGPIKFALGAGLKDLRRLPVGVYVTVTFVSVAKTRSNHEVKNYDILVDADELASLSD
jgi:hypothetical protein